MRSELPTGEVTLLFTDVEGSTQLLHEIGAERYAALLAEHRRLVRAAVAEHGGVEVDTQGDAFLVAFASATGAVAAAALAQASLAAGPVRVRMGLHTGRPLLAEEGYVGEDVHLGARIGAAGHGGQVLLSPASRWLVQGEFAELGEHRLKDFAEPVALFQLGSARFPPLKTLSNTNLPRPASSFVGREREIDEVAALLRGADRLVTLTGPGGSGKTRLAIEAAAESVGEFKSLFWVELAPLRDPALVLQAIGQALGVTGDTAAAIRERELLLVLDNFEQVIDAAPDLSGLLRACPNLRVLVTSRELLRIDGEAEYAVSALTDAEAVALFAARAHAEQDGAVAELCRRLDNLPLAVELAAARARVLSAPQILDRLGQRLDLLKGGRDADPRQQTLRATIAWSHDLLDEEERRLFARLAVFAGGCTLAGAEVVAEADLDVLQSLVEKSLVRHGRGRFWMLETIREYAGEQLDASGERDEVERRLYDHLLRLAEEAFPNLKAHSGPWLDRLEDEHDNLRAVLDRAEAAGEIQAALRLCGELSTFWYRRGYLREGRERIERLLSLDGAETPARANALLGLSPLAIASGGHERALAAATDALALLERFAGDPWRIVHARFMTGMVALDLGDVETALPVLETSAAAFRALGDDYYARLTLFDLGYCYQQLDRLDRARASYQRVLELARAAGDERNEGLACGGLGVISRYEGRSADALRYYARSLRIWSRLGQRLELGRDLGRVATTLAKARERPADALRFQAAAVAVREQTGAVEPWYAEQDEENLAFVRERLDDDAFERAWAEGSTMTVDEALALLDVASELPA